MRRSWLHDHELGWTSWLWLMEWRQGGCLSNHYPSKLFFHHYDIIMTCHINEGGHTVQFLSAPPSLCENLLIRTCTRSWGDLHLLHLSFGSLFLALFPVLVTAELHPLAETAVIIIRGMGGERDPVNVWMCGCYAGLLWVFPLMWDTNQYLSNL